MVSVKKSEVRNLLMPWLVLRKYSVHQFLEVRTHRYVRRTSAQMSIRYSLGEV